MNHGMLVINRSDLSGMLREVVANRGRYVQAERMIDMLASLSRTADNEPAWVGSNYTRESFANGFAFEGESREAAATLAANLFGSLAQAKGEAIAREMRESR